MFKMLFLMVLVLFSLKAYSVECEKLFSLPHFLKKMDIVKRVEDTLGKKLSPAADFIVDHIMHSRGFYNPESSNFFKENNFLVDNFSVFEILALHYYFISKDKQALWRLYNMTCLLDVIRTEQKINTHQIHLTVLLESHIHKINNSRKMRVYDYELLIRSFNELADTLESPHVISGLLSHPEFFVNQDNKRGFLAYLKSRDRAEEEMGEGLTDSQSTALVKLQKKWSTLRISSSKLLDKNFEDDYYSTLIESGLTRHDGYILLKNGLLLSSVSFLLKKEKIVAKIEDILHRRLTPSQVQKIVGNNTTGEIYSIFRTKSSKFNNFHIMLLLNNKGFSLDEIYNLIDNGVIKSKNARERLDKLAFKVEEVKKRLNKKELSPKQIRAILNDEEIEMEPKNKLPFPPPFA